MKVGACLLAVLLGAFALAMPAPAHAGSSTDAALALGSFAVLNQLVRGETVLHSLFAGPRLATAQTVVVQPPPQVIYAPPPVVYAPPPQVIYAPAPVYYAPAPVAYVPVHRHYKPHRHFIPPGHLKRYRH